MTIEYDSERKRSTDLESGLAVEWVRDEPPLERRTHFKLIVDGKGTPFESSYDFGDRNIEKEYMNVSAMEIWKKTSKKRHMYYRAENIDSIFDENLFLKVWQNLVSQESYEYRFSVEYRKFAMANPAGGEVWRLDP